MANHVKAKNKKTGVEYKWTPEEYERMKGSPFIDAFDVEETKEPGEVKEVRNQLGQAAVKTDLKKDQP